MFGNATTAAYRVAKVHPEAQIPKPATPGAAGMDLVACETVQIPGNGAWLAVETGLMLQFPPTVYARVAPRSGLAFKHGIQVGAGVIDSDYRGTVKVILFNHGKEPFDVRSGDRIAQLIFEKIELPTLMECSPDDLTATVRSSGGFGSTGV
jgi:dUTP pyrophosphatase